MKREVVSLGMRGIFLNIKIKEKIGEMQIGLRILYCKGDATHYLKRQAEGLQRLRVVRQLRVQ